MNAKLFGLAPRLRPSWEFDFSAILGMALIHRRARKSQIHLARAVVDGHAGNAAPGWVDVWHLLRPGIGAR